MTAPAEHGDTPDLTDAECVAIVRASIDPDRVFNGRTARDGFPADVLLTTVERILADRLSARSAATPDTAAQVERVQALAANWARLAGQAMDQDTREWLTAASSSLRAALDPGTRDQADQGGRA